MEILQSGNMGVSMKESENLTADSIRELIKAAIEARRKSYSPYSHYQVGAALLTADGQIVTGCNIENAAYGPSNCAERTAFFKAVSEGIREFTAIAIVGSPEGEELTQYAYPCGVCRQVMRESEEDYRVMTLAALLPESFGPENLCDGNEQCQR